MKKSLTVYQRWRNGRIIQARSWQVSASSSAHRRQHSYQSSLVVDEDDESVFREDGPITSKPRLTALREQLGREGGSTVKLSQYTPQQPQASPSSAPYSPPPAPVRLPNKGPPQSLDEWIELLNGLPDPPTDQVLVDSFQRRHTYLRLSLTERCNLRCVYCMPEQGVPLQPPSHLLQTHELIQLARYFRQLGVTKFRLTGGEPTLRSDLVEIVHALHTLQPSLIGMTTNGILIPKLLPSLVDAGLTSLNLSLDTLDANKFAQLTRRPAKYLDRVWQALELSQQVSYADTLTVKLNCVVMRGVNDDEVSDFCHLTNEFPRLHVRFIEYMPFTENGWNLDKFIGYQELLLPELVPVPSEDPHDTTKWYALPTAAATAAAGGGRIGFITSMSSHFCASCNRLRLTADGQLKVCLFDGRTELSLRDAIRVGGLSEQHWHKLVYAALQSKRDSLGGHPDPQSIQQHAKTNRPMTLIGG